MAQSAIPVRVTSQLHLGWLGLGVLLVAVAMLAGIVGYAVAENQAAPTSPDQALVDDLNAAWSGPYDAAKLAALYAPNATFYDTIAGATSAGLEAIQAKASAYSGSGFTTALTSAPIRQGDFLAFFEKHGTSGSALDGGLVVLQLQDGKVLNQWVYRAP